MITAVNAGCNEFKLLCDKCRKETPVVGFAKLRESSRQLGWYHIDNFPSRTQSLDICDKCGKKHTLAKLVKECAR